MKVFQAVLWEDPIVLNLSIQTEERQTSHSLSDIKKTACTTILKGDFFTQANEDL